MSLGVPSSRHALEEAANTQKMLWSTFQGPPPCYAGVPLTAHPPSLRAPPQVHPGSIHSLFSEATLPHLEAPTWVCTSVPGGWISHKCCSGDSCWSQRV